MPTLPRAPRERALWFWDLYDFDAPGLESALSLAARMGEVLYRHALLTPVRLEYVWTVEGVGPTGITTTLDLSGTQLADPILPDRVRGSRPASHPTAEITDFDVLGTGTWIDADDRFRTEYRLVDVSVSTAPTGLSAELSVHHDIWGRYAFSGRPHLEVQRRNAPRLAAALKDLTDLLGGSPELGERTHFGMATIDGVAEPEADENGWGPDVSGWL
ncbi:hypothetical protein ACH4UY_05330 [Streptomyces longwoodensis]|uniref:hypothetical protein n=1 Tax=Streptomyces longwoodensis TaxID=68231 RepID=UPI003795D353